MKLKDGPYCVGLKLNRLRIADRMSEQRRYEAASHEVAARLRFEVDKEAPECIGCGMRKEEVHALMNVMRDTYEIQGKARCTASACFKEEPMARLNDFFTPGPGWSTSKPGDMKNSMGLPTRYDKPSPLGAGAAISSTLINTSTITAEKINAASVTMAGDAFDAAEAMRLMNDSVKSFEREYMTDPLGMRQPQAAAPMIDRDTPQTDLDGAW